MKWEDVKKLNDLLIEVRSKGIDTSNLYEVRRAMLQHPDYGLDGVENIEGLLSTAYDDSVIGVEISDHPCCEYWVWHPSAIEFMKTKGVILVNVWFVEEYPIITEFERPKEWKETNEDEIFFKP